MKETTYHAIGGQKIRDNQDQGIHTVEIVKRQTDYPAKSGVSGADSFTNSMWNTDPERIKQWAKDWAYNPSKLKFKLVDLTA